MPGVHPNLSGAGQPGGPDPAARLAQAFAAKEACTKALGTGLRKGVFLRDIGVRGLPTGQPILELTGGALRRLHAMVPDGMEPRIDVSLTDDGGMAHAVVIIWAISASERKRLDMGHADWLDRRT